MLKASQSTTDASFQDGLLNTLFLLSFPPLLFLFFFPESQKSDGHFHMFTKFSGVTSINSPPLPLGKRFESILAYRLEKWIHYLFMYLFGSQFCLASVEAFALIAEWACRLCTKCSSVICLKIKCCGSPVFTEGVIIHRLWLLIRVQVFLLFHCQNNRGHFGYDTWLYLIWTDWSHTLHACNNTSYNPQGSCACPLKDSSKKATK